MADIYGPQLPPNFRNKKSVPEDEEHSQRRESNSSKEAESSVGPVLPTQSKESLQEDKNCIKDNSNTSDDSDAYLGPALPPGFKANFCESQEKKLNSEENKANKEKSTISIGPSLPPGFKLNEEEENTEEDVDFYGPMPPGYHSKIQSEVEQSLNIRAKLVKQKLAEEGMAKESDAGPTRDLWMLELPAGRSAALGLGARSFRSKEGPDMSDRSSWTDTPEEKKRKEELRLMGVEEKKINPDEEIQKAAIKARDELMEKELKKVKKKRSEKSLLDLHQEKLRKKEKKEKKEGKLQERRPFSREIDLQVNRFDDAQKKAVIKKASLLNDRFSQGEAKFL